ncbi:ABC transporter ATP-binding protein [Vibrio gazogenes]|uniref:Oligopeptide transport system ATP-binding protein n=1 Tax=Vibrio gazogenes DSM 21264 = NBRC 103151 TaxID=1123492 RepID=A0A1M4UUM4_VIBGA|nr:dipeptide ABC transporter ATP-binding protein [Vibrio gazogenes]USP15672.1 dipeptide ABC transporter ATP-binding protein [Vibrio gazogenes]SHE60461.1 oligopeptide transport system ATP-binding protein [Vibrio gazogenes DSM 21264] [Vibrio gazogenes DSM 21264 = NBRC 103151]SJN56130.1 Oligopeptide transport ATP-binding protein OppF [Vibrio gazogenes]
MSDILLEVKGLEKHFYAGKSLFKRTRSVCKAVDNVSFKIHQGKTLGLVGESGCGKSTLGRCILRLIEPSAGTVTISGQDITRMNARELKAMRKEMQMIFQDPFASLSPRMTIHDILREPLDIHNIGTVAQREEKIAEVMHTVGLRPQALNRYPHEFSGGQRQRVGIARALVLEPKLIIADEPVSALDVSVQAQVLNLIAELQETRGISFLFIAHDLAVVQHTCDEVGVMYLGKMVERAPAEILYRQPKHPYTQALLSAIPVPDPTHNTEHVPLIGDIPSPLNPPSGCAFHPRCKYATERCSREAPTLTQTQQDEHWIACHLYPAS